MIKNWLKIIWWEIDKISKYLIKFDKIESYKDGELIWKIELTKKQKKAWSILTDNKKDEILFWWAVWWWKSFVWSLWIIIDCLLNEDVRYLIGRRQLSDLQDTTLKTYNEILNLLWLKEWEDYKLNQQSKSYKFKNNSECVYRDLQFQPRDSLYNRLGWLELTGYFLDESQEINRQAVTVLNSRLRRTEKKDVNWNLIWKKIWKSLYTCNPWKNFVYTDFYLPFKQWELKENKSFIFSNILDNPHLPEKYVKKLKKLNKQDYERLVNWNFDYDNDPLLLFNYDDLLQLFYTDVIKEDNKMYMSIDLSWKWNDKTVILIWKWLQIVNIIEEAKTDWTKLIPKLEKFEKKYNINRRNIVIDSDWLWENFIDFYPNYYRFKGWHSYFKDERLWKDEERYQTKFKNLRTQCYFLLSDYIKENKIWINKELEAFKDNITTELWFVKEIIQENWIKSILSKKEIIENLWHSPDYADAIMMRFAFELDNNNWDYSIVIW